MTAKVQLSATLDPDAISQDRAENAELPAAALRLLDEFDSAWQGECRPTIANWLLKASDFPVELRDRMLRELIKIDLEYRWRLLTKAALDEIVGKGPYLGEYVAEFPALGALSQLPLDLIGEEYRVRQRFGDRPPHSAYHIRFREHGLALTAALTAIDRDLAREWTPTDASAAEHGDRVPPTALRKTSRGIDPAAPLVHTDYVLQRRIGAGGMGKVYLAWQKSLERPVAVKVLRKAYLRIPGAVERFVQEARLIARLRHPGIVGIHGLGRFPAGGYFIVMDYVGGGDLAARIVQEALPEKDIVGWMIEVAAAIAHAHLQGVIHCDLKPSNVLVDETGKPVVTDFGLARPAAADWTELLEIAGTAGYMAPEQIDDAWGPIGPATDVHGLGALLYALLAGDAPFAGGTVPDILARVVSGSEPRPVEEHRPDVSVELAKLCQRCLLPDPMMRCRNAEEVMQELHKIELRI